MQHKDAALEPLASLSLSAEDKIILKWLRAVRWETAAGPHGSIVYTAKVPEFYGSVRLYRMQAGGTPGSLGALELFIKKLALQRVISKQEMYPVSGHGTQARFISFKKADMDNLGIGKEDEDDE
jgi:hypothetical protein